MKHICLISNCAPTYRKGIFDLLDKNYSVNWVFGQIDNIKDLDTTYYKGVVYKSSIIRLPIGTYLVKGAIRQAFNRRNEYYFIIGDAKCMSAWVSALIAKLRGKKVVYWSHGSLREVTGLRRTVMSLFWRLADCGLIYNNRSREIMAKANVGCSKFVTVYNSLNYDKQLELRRQLTKSDIYTTHFGNSYPVIAFIGRLIQSKKLEQVLMSCAKINSIKDGLKVNIVIIGDGAERERLQAMTNELGIKENVWFYGACYDEYTNAQLLYNADLCVSPGEVGLTAIHALMFGLPVATHDNFNHQGPEYEAIIPGKTGVFFREGDVDDLTDKVAKWLSKKADCRDLVRKDCYEVVDTTWNPANQFSIIDRTLSNL